MIFAVFLIVLGVVLALHHGYKHFCEDPTKSNAQKESCIGACYLQPKDISNHETWILICFTNAFSIGYLGPAMLGCAR